MQKVLVTGGTGFIGSHTVIELMANGYEVIVVDNLSNSSRDILKGIKRIAGKEPLFYEIDCTDFSKLSEVFKENPNISGVIHFAAYKAVKESLEKPLDYYRNNVFSMVLLLEAMQNAGVNNLIFSSSCTIYGENAPLPYTEDMPMTPTTSPYGRTKQMSESIIADYATVQPDFKYISLRYFNPIGAHDSGLIGELPTGIPNNLIPFITQTALGIRKELKVFGNDYPTPDGTAMRDYIDVVDLSKAHVIALKRVLNKEHDSQFEAFNLGSGKGISVREIIDTFEQVNNIKINWSFAARRQGDIPQIFADTSKAKQVLSWEAKTPLSQSLRNAWQWEQNFRNENV